MELLVNCQRAGIIKSKLTDRSVGYENNRRNT